MGSMVEVRQTALQTAILRRSEAYSVELPIPLNPPNSRNLSKLHWSRSIPLTLPMTFAALPSKVITERHLASLFSIPLILSLLSDTSLTINDISVAASLTRGIGQFCANSVATSNMAEVVLEMPDDKSRPAFEESPPRLPPVFELQGKKRKSVVNDTACNQRNALRCRR